MRLEIFKVYQTSISKYAEIEVVSNCIDWLNTNFTTGKTQMICDMPGKLNPPLKMDLEVVNSVVAKNFLNKVTHKINLPFTYTRRLKLYVNLNKDQLNEIYPIEKMTVNKSEILNLIFAGITAIAALLTLAAKLIK